MFPLVGTYRTRRAALEACLAYALNGRRWEPVQHGRRWAIRRVR